MEHQGNSLFVEDLPDNCEVCACCGDKAYPHNPLKWKIENDVGFPPDLYCDRCHWDFRRAEMAEEAVIQAIKLARLEEIFTLEELQRAMDGVCGATSSTFASYIEKGTTSSLVQRTFEELSAAGQIKPDHTSVGGRDAA